MDQNLSHVCFVGVYGNNQNDVLRDGLRSRGVTVANAGLSARDTDIVVAGRQLPVYAMKPTLNWCSRFPTVLLPILFAVAFFAHAAVTYACLAANWRAVRRTDVLVVPHMGDTSTILVKPVAVLTGRPLVYISHNGLYSTLVENRTVYASGSLAGKFISFLDMLIQRNADRVVVFSDYSGQLFSERYGVPERQYETVYIGVDESRFNPVDPEPPEEPVDILYWGNFIPHHGVDVMVEAAAAVPDYDFVFAGDSRHRSSVEETAAELGASNVRFPGFVSDSELAGLVESAAVVLGPIGTHTQTSMTVGTKVAEAAYMEAAVIVGDHPAPNELFENRESAMLVDPGNPASVAAAVAAVVENPTLRSRLESGVRGIYEEFFSPERVADQFIDAVPRE